MSKDPYGLIWMALMFLVVMGAKWWHFSPANPEDNNCVACVVAVIWVVSILVYTLLPVFWILWSKKYEKGTAFIFLLCLACLVLALVDYEVVQYIIGKLFYGGSLRWEESQASYLIDSFIPHSIGLLVICSIVYSTVRVLLCRDLAEKPLVFTFGVIIVLAALPLFYIGLWLY